MQLLSDKAFLATRTRDTREFSIGRERRHVTPWSSSAPSSTGHCAPAPVRGQREAQDSGREPPIARWAMNLNEALMLRARRADAQPLRPLLWN